MKHLSIIAIVLCMASSLFASVEATLGVQLWENGPYWAECNVGATKPEEYGYYFWWGDTVGYKRSGGYDDGEDCISGVTWVLSSGSAMSSSPFCNCPTNYKNVPSLLSDGYIDASGNLVAQYDAATANLGAPWRMPTATEIDALISNCNTYWTTSNGVSGLLVTGKDEYKSKSIFLPAPGGGNEDRLEDLNIMGSYWSSTPDADNNNKAWRLRFYGSNVAIRKNYDRCGGQSVRAVRDAAIDKGLPELPDNPTSEDVANALTGSVDAKVVEKVTTPTEYNAYREWANGVKATGSSELAGLEAVKSSPNAWQAFAVKSAALLEKPIEDGDLEVKAFEPSAQDGKYDFTVEVEGVNIGSEALADHLKSVFGLEGGATLDALSSDNVDISFSNPENGKLKFTAEPKDTSATSFFMRVKVK